jgi:hypothetical protein
MASDQSGARDTATSAQTGAEAGGTRQYVPRQAPRYDTRLKAAALGVTLAAAVLMMVSGVLNILEGIAAIVQSTVVVVLPNYVYSLSATGWGWFHVGIGILVLAAGIGLFTDKAWARAVGVGVVAISLIVNFLYIPYLPIWSLVLIGIDLAILWALLTPRRGERMA